MTSTETEREDDSKPILPPWCQWQTSIGTVEYSTQGHGYVTFVVVMCGSGQPIGKVDVRLNLREEGFSIGVSSNDLKDAWRCENTYRIEPSKKRKRRKKKNEVPPKSGFMLGNVGETSGANGKPEDVN